MSCLVVKEGKKFKKGSRTAPLLRYSCWLIGILCRTVWKCGRRTDMSHNPLYCALCCYDLFRSHFWTFSWEATLLIQYFKVWEEKKGKSHSSSIRGDRNSYLVRNKKMVQGLFWCSHCVYSAVSRFLCYAPDRLFQMSIFCPKIDLGRRKENIVGAFKVKIWKFEMKKTLIRVTWFLQIRVGWILEFKNSK